MSKDEARSILETHLRNPGLARLPRVDEIVYEKKADNAINEFSFKYLIKIAYDLTDEE